jgi:hypothetical protein
MTHTKNVIPMMNIMRRGPSGFTGTDAPCSSVKAGVYSCTFAIAACN